MRKAIRFGAGALIVAAATLAWTRTERRGDDAVRHYPVTGVVVAPVDGGRLTVAHDDIPGYMPAMTMAFTIGEGAPPSLGPGDRVRFVLRVDGQTSRAEGLQRIGYERAPVPAARGAVARLKPGDALPAVTLVDDGGRPVAGGDFLGHPTVLTFIFTRCPQPDFCPLVTSRFKALQAALARDRSLPGGTRLLSVTIDPAFDTPPVLAAYARAVGADPARWRFAGGEPEAVTQFARAFSVYVERNGALLDHTLATALVDGSGRVVEIWRGNGWKAEEILQALRRHPHAAGLDSAGGRPDE